MENCSLITVHNNISFLKTVLDLQRSTADIPSSEYQRNLCALVQYLIDQIAKDSTLIKLDEQLYQTI